MYTFQKYSGRTWAVYDPDGELICVCAYLKGAREAARRLNELAQSNTKHKSIKR